MGMSDVMIHCRHCGSELLIHEELAGKTVTCPECNQNLVVSQILDGKAFHQPGSLAAGVQLRVEGVNESLRSLQRRSVHMQNEIKSLSEACALMMKQAELLQDFSRKMKRGHSSPKTRKVERVDLVQDEELFEQSASPQWRQLTLLFGGLMLLMLIGVLVLLSR